MRQNIQKHNNSVNKKKININEDFINAASDGDIQKVKSYLQQNIDTNVQNSKEFTAVMLAVAEGHEEIFDILHEHHADLLLKGPNNISTLFLAARKNRTSIFKKLISHKYDLNEQVTTGDTVLHWAIMNENSEIVDLLLNKGACPNLTDFSGQSPLMMAAYQGNYDIALKLIKAGADISYTKDSAPKQNALITAASRDHINIVKLLVGIDKIKALGNVRLIDVFCLSFMSKCQNTEIAIYLLDHYSAPEGYFGVNETTFSALGLALVNEHRDLAIKLLLKGADPNMKMTEGNDLVPLFFAIDHNDHELLSLLLNCGADVNAVYMGGSPVILAHSTGQVDMVETLLKHNCSLSRMYLIFLSNLANEQLGYSINSELGSEINSAWLAAMGSNSSDINDIKMSILNCKFVTDKFSEIQPVTKESIKLKEEYVGYLYEYVTRADSLLNQFVDFTVERVKVNFAGTRKRRSEEDRIISKIIDEISCQIANVSDLYEDSKEAFAIAEFILARIPFSIIVKAARSNKLPHTNYVKGANYEITCKTISEEYGYTVTHIGKSGDQGADLIINKNGKSYVIQCKNYAGTVGNKAVQEALSAKNYYSTDYAAVISEGKFTTSAIELAARLKIVLTSTVGLQNLEIICDALS